MPKDQFKREAEKEPTGKESEPWEIIYFKLYQSQIPVVEQAIETAALMLGTDKSRGYCLGMICADFLAGASRISSDLPPTNLSRIASAPQTIMLSNTGNAILNISEIGASRTFAQANSSPASLSVGATCTIAGRNRPVVPSLTSFGFAV